MEDRDSFTEHGPSSILLDEGASFPFPIRTIADDTTQVGCQSKGLCLSGPSQLFSDLLLNSRLAYPTIFLFFKELGFES